MKAVATLLSLCFLVACGTTREIRREGEVQPQLIDGSQVLAPVLLVYKTYFSDHEHEIFFWDQDKNRQNLKIPAGTDTTKGILIYLPVGKSYALSGMLYPTRGHYMDASFGTELTLFRPKVGRITQLSYFAVEDTSQISTDTFVIKRSSPKDQAVYLKPVRQNFKISLPIDSVEAF